MTPERIERLRSVLDKRQPDLTVVTDYVHKGRNLSAIVRTADAVGVMDIHCAMGEADYKKFRGTAMGSHSWVNVQRYASIDAPIAGLKAKGFQIVATHLSAQAVDFHDVDYTKPTALLLGSEKKGISEDAGDLADVHVTIPMSGMVESFNVSVAAGIVLIEAQYQRQQKSLYSKRRIDQSLYDRLFFEWAHPKVREFCLYNHLDYPPLREDGEIDKPSEWYAKMRELLAQRQIADN
jgi:tRNA (guanosine-2'-O-)-methyltransferase